MGDTALLEEKLFIINQIPLFANLSQKDKEVIARSSAIVEYKKDDIVYKEGDPADGFRCVISGRLNVYILKGIEQEHLELLTRGKYFGIISLLTGESHSATIQAVTDSIILNIPKDDFNKILKRVPQLYIHLSQTLSRRLKRKDIHEKRVFESTVISIFGTSNKIGATNYVLNLGVSLKRETNKNVILLNISRTGADISALLGVSVGPKPLFLNHPFFDEGVIRGSILKHRLGIDMMNIPHKPDDKPAITHVISLLSYLTNDYHYVLVDLPSYIDKTTFEALKQSDMIHLITAADEPSLTFTAKFISELEKSSSDIGQRIKVITNEYGIIKMIDFHNRRSILKHDVFATLPDPAKSEDDIGHSRIPVLTEYPDCEYSRAIRRISREIGGCLIGLALGSGAAMGFAHIGVLKVIEKERLPIDIIAGTSIGALIGGLWAAGKNACEIEKIIAVFKKIRTFNLVDLTFPRKGLMKGGQIRRFLRSHLGDTTFHNLRLPFKVVTCDIEKREEVVIDSGSLVDAISASIAIPGVFEPVRMGGRLLVDGGIINPLPTNILMRMGVAKIIAVNALPSPEDIQRSGRKVSNIFDVMINSAQASEYLLAQMAGQSADIVMHPALPAVEWYAFYEGARIVRRGEEEALKYLPQLKALAAS